MTPNEKAVEIYNRITFESSNKLVKIEAKRIALYFVSEILEEVFNDFGNHEGTCFGVDDYWNDVKKEIENL